MTFAYLLLGTVLFKNCERSAITTAGFCLIFPGHFLLGHWFLQITQSREGWLNNKWLIYGLPVVFALMITLLLYPLFTISGLLSGILLRHVYRKSPQKPVKEFQAPPRPESVEEEKPDPLEKATINYQQKIEQLHRTLDGESLQDALEEAERRHLQKVDKLL